MPDFLEKLVVAAITATATLLIAFAGYKLKRRGDRLEALRKAYSQWFAAETVFMRKVNDLIPTRVGNLEAKKQYSVLTKAAKPLEEELRPLIASINDILTLENNRDFRERLSALHDCLEMTIDMMHNIASSYRYRLGYKSIGKFIHDSLLTEEDEAKRRGLLEATDMMAEWDKDLPDNLDLTESIGDIVKSSKDLHKLASNLKSMVSTRFN